MNTPSVAHDQGKDSRRSRCGMRNASEAASAWYGRSVWRTTTLLVRSIVAIVVITGTLTLMGCGDDDDGDDGASETLSQGGIASDFRNVMPLVNDRNVVFPGGVMGATAPATLSVTGFATCDDIDCAGSFTLAGGDGVDSEGDSGGEASCFFLFQDGDIQPEDTQIDCGTCKLELVEDCVIREGQLTSCRVRWFLAVAEDVPPENAAASEPFDVTLTLENGDFVAILAGGERVILVDEDDI